MHRLSKSQAKHQSLWITRMASVWSSLFDGGIHTVDGRNSEQ